MPQIGHLVRVFVGSPDDLTEERQLVVQEITRWNARHSRGSGVMIEAVLWETHATGDLRKRPQEIINRQLADSCDFLVALFWTKLGGGGTRKEINEFMRHDKRVLLLFSNKRFSTDVNGAKFDELKKFKADMQQRGLVQDFKDDNALCDTLQRGLSHEIEELKLAPPHVRSEGSGQAQFVQDSDIRGIISNRLADPAVRKITVIVYTNEVDFYALIRPHIVQHSKHCEIYKRSLVADLAEQQETNLSRLAQGRGDLRSWDKLRISKDATEFFTRVQTHSTKNVTVNQYFYDQPPTKRAYIFDDFREAIIGYYAVKGELDEEGGAVYKGIKGVPSLMVTDQDKFGRHVLAELREYVTALRRVSRTWEEERQALEQCNFLPSFDVKRRPCINPKAVFLDLDGVLYDSMPGYVDAWQRAFETLDIPFSEEDVYREEGRNGKETIRRAALKASRSLTDAEVEAAHRVRNERLSQLGVPSQQKGASALLAGIKADSLLIRVVTGSTRPDIGREIATVFDAYVREEDVISGDQLLQSKPDPEPYREACRRTGVCPEEAIVIENAPLGIEAAHKCGCFCIAVNTGILPDKDLLNAGARVVFKDCAQLARLWPEILGVMKVNKINS